MIELSLDGKHASGSRGRKVEGGVCQDDVPAWCLTCRNLLVCLSLHFSQTSIHGSDQADTLSCHSMYTLP